jgi:hypothetical protein
MQLFPQIDVKKVFFRLFLYAVQSYLPERDAKKAVRQSRLGQNPSPP